MVLYLDQAGDQDGWIHPLKGQQVPERVGVVGERPSLSRPGVPGRLPWRPNWQDGDVADTSIGTELRLEDHRISPDQRWALKGSRGLVWRAAEAGPRQLIIEKWFLEVVWCFVLGSLATFNTCTSSRPSCTHRPVSKSGVCWQNPNVPIWKKLPRFLNILISSRNP